MSFCTFSLLNDIEILWMIDRRKRMSQTIAQYNDDYQRKGLWQQKNKNSNEKNGCSPPQVVCIRHCVGHLQVTSGAMRPEQ